MKMFVSEKDLEQLRTNMQNRLKIMSEENYDMRKSHQDLLVKFKLLIDYLNVEIEHVEASKKYVKKPSGERG